jgi:transcriptional regulator with XRE-family HTH domain
MVLLRHLLGDALRRLRLRQGRTLREVSAAARVSLGYLSEVERGQKEASSELLGSICSALGTPLSQVLREVSDNFALAELQSEPVLTAVREPVVTPAAAPGEAGPAPAKAALGARRSPALTPLKGAPAMGRGDRRVPVRAGQRLSADQDEVIDASLQQGRAVFDELTWRTPDITDMVPV